MLKIYNTLTNKKEDFIPVNAPLVKMYVCGVTSYDFCHLGHSRVYIVFDIVKRYLEYINYKVLHIQNFTDIDDKIIKRANELNVPPELLAEKYIYEYFIDIDKLNVLHADVYPRATEMISEMQKFISILLEKGYAYKVGDDIYFEVNKFKEYGKLSGKKLDELIEGHRVDSCEYKKSGLDFVLWKGKKEGEPFWDSDFGPGRPGWHIECSVMSSHYLDMPFDIHGGGMDLIFPHHENEIAQSEAYSGKQFAKYWLHNAFVKINSEKMSKSLGNVFFLKDLYKKYPPEIIRYYISTIHYRNPIEFNDVTLNAAKNSYEKLKFSIKRYKEFLDNNINSMDKFEKVNTTNNEFYEYRNKFKGFMNDDFNTSGAVSVIFDLIKKMNIIMESDDVNVIYFLKLYNLLLELCDVLGIFFPETSSQKNENFEKVIDKILDYRRDMRAEKNFDVSDKIRDILTESGIEITDLPDKTKWNIKSILRP